MPIAMLYCGNTRDDDMIRTPLHKERKWAEKQYNALFRLANSQEERLSLAYTRIKELEKELLLVDRAQIDALYSENERLTNLLEGV